MDFISEAMKKLLCLFSAVLALSAVTAFAADPPGAVIALKAARLFDGKSKAP